MTDRNTLQTVRKAREIMDRVTPLRRDCGAFCDAACCKGDAGTGMLLFPGEYELLKNIPGFSFLDTTHPAGGTLLVCGGVCERKNRPLACMFFPYFPLLEPTPDGELYDVRSDIRAISCCPLLQADVAPDPAFLRAVRRAGRALGRNAATKDFLLQLNRLMDEQLQWYTNLNG